MLKLNASYSKKIPVEDREYSSQSFHCAVEVELPDGLAPEELDRRIHETFELVRGSVEAELDGGFRQPAPAPRREGGRRQPQFQPPRKTNVQPASNKQLAYLRDIAVRKGMAIEELEHAAHMQFGAESHTRLSREQASRLIDWLGSANGTGQAA